MDIRLTTVDSAKNTSTTNGSSIGTGIPSWKIRQRYVLALLYIATTSNENIIGTQWGSSSNNTTKSEEESEEGENDKGGEGEDNNKDWYRTLNFLSSKDECEWYTSYTTCNLWGANPEDCPEADVETKGVVCNEMGEVTSIILCKYLCCVCVLLFPCCR